MSAMRGWISSEIQWNAKRWKPSKGGSDSKSEVSSTNSESLTSISPRYNAGTRSAFMVTDSPRDLLGYGSIFQTGDRGGIPRKRGRTQWRYQVDPSIRLHPNNVSLEPETSRQHRSRSDLECKKCHYHQTTDLEESKLLNHTSKTTTTRRKSISQVLFIVALYVPSLLR